MGLAGICVEKKMSRLSQKEVGFGFLIGGDGK